MTERNTSARPKFNPTTGCWDFVIDAGIAPDGKRKQIRRRGFPTERECQAALDRTRASLVDDSFVPASKQSLGGFLNDEWLPVRLNSIALSTFAGDEDKIRLYVIPHLGGRRLQALDAGALNRLYADLLDCGGKDGKPLSPRTVRMVHTLLHRALGDAVRWGRLQRNIVEAASPPRAADARPPEMKTWTAPQVGTFLQAEKDNRYHPAFVFLVTTGVRRSECLGLRWADLDLDAKIASIRQTVTVVRRKILVSPGTKTKAAHVINLDEATIKVLRAWRKTQLEERMLQDQFYEDSDLVFCLPDGRPYHPDRFSREFKRRQARHSVAPEIRLHDLRHTWATLALQNNIHPKVVQERLGHSSITVTLDMYSHVTRPMQTDAAERVASAIFGA